MLRRPVTLWESFDFNIRSDLCLAFEVADKSAVSQLLNNLDRSVIGLHLKYEDGYFITDSSPSPRYRIPNEIRDLQRSTVWLNLKHPLKYSDRLGYLGFNDTKVVLNGNHSVSDGGYFKFLTGRLFENSPLHLPRFPITIEELFEGEFKFAKILFYPEHIIL
jgi:hypothetical protein